MAYFHLLQILLCMFLYNTLIIGIIESKSTTQDITQQNEQLANTSELKISESLNIKHFESLGRINQLGELIKDINLRILEFQEPLAFPGFRKGRSSYSSSCNRRKTEQEFVDLAIRRKTFTTSNHDTSTFFHTNMVDGNPTTAYASKVKELNPWVAVDLEGCRKIFEIKLHLRIIIHSRDMEIYISDELKDISNRDFSKDILFATFAGPATNALYSFKPKDSEYVEGRYVYITKHSNIDHLDVAELEVLGF